jgi:predicted amidohydrolase
MAFQVRAAVIQFPVTMDIAANLGSLSTALEALDSGTFAVAPEGALSGYLPENSDWVLNQARSDVVAVRSLP